jgi:hypothetical protein
MIDCVVMSEKLADNLAVYRRIYGTRWADVVADMGGALRSRMNATGESNPIAAALPVAKEMHRDNVNPMLLLAVATELSMLK